MFTPGYNPGALGTPYPNTAPGEIVSGIASAFGNRYYQSAHAQNEILRTDLPGPDYDDYDDYDYSKERDALMPKFLKSWAL